MIPTDPVRTPLCDDWWPLFVARLAETGGKVRTAAERAGVSRQAVYARCRRPEYRAVVREIRLQVRIAKIRRAERKTVIQP